MPVSATTARIIELIRAIPSGKVASYAQIAKMAGLTNGARQVSRILHSCSKKYALPWHRVIRADGSIALAEGRGAALQRSLLQAEGIAFDASNLVDMSQYGWCLT